MIKPRDTLIFYFAITIFATIGYLFLAKIFLGYVELLLIVILALIFTIYKISKHLKNKWHVVWLAIGAHLLYLAIIQGLLLSNSEFFSKFTRIGTGQLAPGPSSNSPFGCPVDTIFNESIQECVNQK